MYCIGEIINFSYVKTRYRGLSLAHSCQKWTTTDQMWYPYLLFYALQSIYLALYTSYSKPKCPKASSGDSVLSIVDLANSYNILHRIWQLLAAPSGTILRPSINILLCQLMRTTRHPIVRQGIASHNGWEEIRLYLAIASFLCGPSLWYGHHGLHCFLAASPRRIH